MGTFLILNLKRSYCQWHNPNTSRPPRDGMYHRARFPYATVVPVWVLRNANVIARRRQAARRGFSALRSEQTTCGFCGCLTRLERLWCGWKACGPEFAAGAAGAGDLARLMTMMVAEPIRAGMGGVLELR